MNNKENMIMQLINSVEKDLVKINDPYQHGMLAVNLATALMQCPVEVGDTAPAQTAPVELAGETVTPKQADAIKDILSIDNQHEQQAASEIIPTNEDLQDKPSKGVVAMNEVSQDIANIMNEAVNQTPAQETPAPAPAPEAPAEPNYDSEEWANKKLSADELDDNWTPRMQKNKDLMMYRTRMQSLIQNGLKSGQIDDAWLNQQFNALSGGSITTWRDPRIASPKAVKLFFPPLYKAATDLMASRRNAAA